MALLEVSGLRAGYAEVDILHGVQLAVEQGEIVCVVGPNGAGKSTLMKAVFGLVPVREGRIVFQGEDITGLGPAQIVRRGMCYVPQNNNVFPSLTVEENLEMGAFIRQGDFRQKMEEMFELFPVLKERRRQKAGTMSGGQQQMVAMARALMLDPKLLLLDEPTAGLSPKFAELVLEKVVEINQRGVSVLMIEQNARAGLAISHRGYVLTMGRNRLDDTGQNLLANEEVGRLFLGG
ncbi:MAG: ABC transporter ATP-binding protein [Firmicutes bacterium ZCTH02-B6]|nr:MAG: ABC transporter ATP-binding protein [Firmicutes bacterium ZCTH02-B6]